MPPTTSRFHFCSAFVVGGCTDNDQTNVCLIMLIGDRMPRGAAPLPGDCQSNSTAHVIMLSVRVAYTGRECSRRGWPQPHQQSFDLHETSCECIEAINRSSRLLNSVVYTQHIPVPRQRAGRPHTPASDVAHPVSGGFAGERGYHMR